MTVPGDEQRPPQSSTRGSVATAACLTLGGMSTTSRREPGPHHDATALPAEPAVHAVPAERAVPLVPAVPAVPAVPLAPPVPLVPLVPLVTQRLEHVRAACRAVVGEALRLVVPLSCAGCGVPDVVVCVPCRGALGSGAWRADGGAPRLARLPVLADGRPVPGDGLVPRWPVLAGTVSSGSVRTLVVSWKDRGRTDCTPLLADRLREVAHAGAGLLAPETLAGREVWVVPAPSTRAAARRRGREHTVELARAATEALREACAPPRGEPGPAPAAGAVGAAARPLVPVVPLVPRAAGRARLVRALVHTRRRTADQTGLGARARGRNLAGALRVGTAGRAEGAVCVLVDDVLTTGATLAECERALEDAGHEVVLGLVLAATPARARQAPGAAPETAASASLLVHSRPRTG